MRTGISRTHIGNVRSKNQDTVYVQSDPSGGFDAMFIVADGMGGHLAGEVASGMAAEAFRDYLKAAPDNIPDTMMFLEEAVASANVTVYVSSMENSDYYGMGTTISAVVLRNGKLYYAHVGDSRVYVIGKGGITQVSKDHSYVAEMVRQGKLTEEEAMYHPNKNVLLRALGTEPTVLVDTGEMVIPEGCFGLICSDGLTNMVADSEILDIISRDGISLEEKADELLNLALKNGGKDNISLIIIY